jgi:hypothetical protein
MKQIILLFICAFLFSCEDQHEMKTKVVETEAVLPDISSVPLDLDMSPEARDMVANCQTCHTARYIQMQPKLSEKAWTKIVDKMVHVFGAPIDSVTAGRIVKYLGTI